MNQEEKISFKKQLIDVCKSLLDIRIQGSEKAMHAAQESANSEEKSSAGDKFETARAMGHRDRNVAARQLNEAKNEMAVLNRINPDQVLEIVTLGAVIESNNSYYFIGAGIGNVKQNELSFIALSLLSPLGLALKGKKKKDAIKFNGKDIIIHDLW